LCETRIEVIAIGKEKVFSVGVVVVSAEGDVYLIHKIKDNDLHLSRHASGETHWKSTKTKWSQIIRKGQPIKEFRGIEFLETAGFGIDSLPELYREYKMKKSDGVFCVDMRQYKEAAFNMTVALLTDEGLPSLVTMSKLLKNRQICVFPDCRPMVMITVGDARMNDAKQ